MLTFTIDFINEQLKHSYQIKEKMLDAVDWQYFAMIGEFLSAIKIYRHQYQKTHGTNIGLTDAKKYICAWQLSHQGTVFSF